MESDPWRSAVISDSPGKGCHFFQHIYQSNRSDPRSSGGEIVLWTKDGQKSRKNAGTFSCIDGRQTVDYGVVGRRASRGGDAVSQDPVRFQAEIYFKISKSHRLNFLPFYLSWAGRCCVWYLVPIGILNIAPVHGVRATPLARQEQPLGLAQD